MGEIVKRLLAILIASTLIISGTSAYADDLEEQSSLQMKKRPIDGDGWLGVTFEHAIDDYLPSVLTAVRGNESNTMDGVETFLCDSTSSSSCKQPNTSLRFRAALSLCKDEKSLDCIESLSATLSNGSVIEGKEASKWNTDLTFPADTNIGLPAGSYQSTWSLPGSNPNGSDEYALNVYLAGGNRDDSLGTNQSTTNPIKFYSFNATLRPVSIDYSSNYLKPVSSIMTRGTGTSLGTNTVATDYGCALAENGKCAKIATFPLDVIYTVKIRLSQEVEPWLHGRLSDPSIKVESLGGRSNRITISASAMQVPTVAGWKKWSDLPKALQSQYPVGHGGTAGNSEDFTRTDIENRILRVEEIAAGSRALQKFRDWIPLLEDKPFAMKTLWSIRTMQNQDPSIKACNKTGFSGLVSTNAAVYSDGPPTFDRDSMSLNYTVGAPHFDKKGAVFSGRYNLAMDSEVARCLYGFSDAPISAKVEIASEDGSPTVAVTTLNQINGWLRLSATGFHYSTPQIKVKLEQEKKVIPAPKKTITCIKGKVTKKVTTSKCPLGYKKKA